MTVVMTLVDPKDAEALEAQLLFHLNAGVDLALVGGGDRQHEVLDVLRRFEGDGRVRQLAAGGSADPPNRTRLSRVAAVEHGAEWVLPVGDGEFWWPHGGNLAELLRRIAARYDAVQALIRPFPPVLGEGCFAERMTYRLSAQAWIGEDHHPLRPSRRYAHRPLDDVEFGDAGQVDGAVFTPLRAWYPIEILWFPFRVGDRDTPMVAPDPLDGSEIDKGLESGTLHVDTRLRDALGSIRDGRALEFPRPTLVESALYAVDSAVLGEGDVVATQRRLDALETRLGAIEANIGVRLERKLRSLVKRGRPAP